MTAVVSSLVEAYEERAAICEFLGNVTREEAEQVARGCLGLGPGVEVPSDSIDVTRDSE